MTFDEWWHQRIPHLVSGEAADDRAIAIAAWEAATKVEREACALLCLAQEDPKPNNPEWGAWGEFEDCARIIRAR